MNEGRFGEYGKKPRALLREEAAKRYTKVKWYIFPLDKEKSPLTTHGHKDASLDAGAFNWEPPCADVAVATGQSKIVVVDTDSSPGHETFLETVDGDPECGLYQITPSGNIQYFYSDPDGIYSSRNDWRTDIDIKAVGGYVAVPHGVTGKGQRTWHGKFSDLGPPPAKLAVLLPKVADTATPPAAGDRPTLEILERHGWTYVGASGDNLYYLRPGKTKGKSATWNGHVLNVFSSSDHVEPFAAGGSYSYKRVVELLEGPKSAWRKRKLAKAWEDSNDEAFFGYLGGASAMLQDEYRGKWKASKRRVKAYDDILKEAKRDFKDVADDREQSGQLLQKEYPTLLEGVDRTVRLNECNQDIEINKEYWDDRSWNVLLNDAKIWAQERGRGVQGENMLNALYAVASQNVYNPLKDYLEALPEATGTAEMDKLVSCFTGEDDGTAARIKAWLVGCVARVYEPAYQNPMLVLQGDQDAGKSYFAEWLCSDLKLYFYKHAIDPTSKDCELMQSRAWIWEVEELETTTGRRSVAQLRAFLTKSVTRLRAPYGKRDMVRTCIANYIGTVNPREFLADETGNRRYLVCFIKEIDWSYSGVQVNGRTLDPTQATKPGLIWAEALGLYRLGPEAWQLTKEEKAEAEKSASEALNTSDVDAWLWKVVNLSNNAAEVVWLDDIIRALHDDGIRVTSDDWLRKQVCKAMKKEDRPVRRRTRSVALGGAGGKNQKAYFHGVTLSASVLLFG